MAVAAGPYCNWVSLHVLNLILSRIKSPLKALSSINPRLGFSYTNSLSRLAYVMKELFTSRVKFVQPIILRIWIDVGGFLNCGGMLQMFLSVNLTATPATIRKNVVIHMRIVIRRIGYILISPGNIGSFAVITRQSHHTYHKRLRKQ